jgi:predicted SprT family Zn-dependent metalloprotease
MPSRTTFERYAVSIQRRLERSYGLDALTPYAVEWSVKGQHRLGVCRSNWNVNGITSVVQLNPQYAEALADEFENTVAHEVCHAVNQRRQYALQYRRNHGLDYSGRWRHHGTEWQNAMHSVGHTPDRIADIPSAIHDQIKPARTVKRVTLHCECTTHQVTPLMLRRHGAAGLTCKFCGTCLTHERNVNARVTQVTLTSATNPE